MDEEEIWKDVPGYEQYYMVSNTGKMFSKFSNRLLTPWMTSHGYMRVSLRLNKTKTTRVFVHRLVALAFIDNPLNKTQVNHIDGNKQNNHVSNLEWVTPSENIQHSMETGFNKCGVDRTTSKLSREDVEYIRQNPLNLSQRKLAKMFGVSKSPIYQVIHYETYK